MHYTVLNCQLVHPVISTRSRMLELETYINSHSLTSLDLPIPTRRYISALCHKILFNIRKHSIWLYWNAFENVNKTAVIVFGINMLHGKMIYMKATVRGTRNPFVILWGPSFAKNVSSHFPLKTHYNTTRWLIMWLKSVKPAWTLQSGVLESYENKGFQCNAFTLGKSHQNNTILQHLFCEPWSSKSVQNHIIFFLGFSYFLFHDNIFLCQIYGSMTKIYTSLYFS